MNPIALLRLRVCLLLYILAAVFAATPTCMGLGSWTNVVNAAPGNVELMLLLSDGTVMAKDAGTNNGAWYRLTADNHGSYIKGTWSTIAPMNFTREFFSSAVLQDGRVFVAGGEYGTGGGTAEVYDPKANVWTTLTVPAGLICTNCGPPGFSDAGSVILSNGTVLIAPVSIGGSEGTVLFNAISNTFSAGPSTAVNQDEATWVKLPDDSILTIDPSSNPSFLNSSERFIPSLNSGQGAWIPDAPLPVAMYNSSTETGAGVLLPDGRAFFIGGNGQTAYYTPSGNSNKGSWTIGPTLFSPGVGWDEPAAMMVNGKLLFQTVLGPPQTPQPRGFYEMDPNVNYPVGTITETPEWGDNSGTSHIMLNLPDGNVLVSYGSATVRVYQPDGNPVAAGKPTVTGVRFNPDGSFHLTGTRLNGISQGSSFGDDAQMDSNYPLVRFLADSGEVTYARTFNWSSTSVQTGSRVVSTEFTMPGSIAGTGAIQLQVVANGIASDPVPFPHVVSTQTLTFSGSSSMGIGPYDIAGGITTFEDDGGASGILLRADGGTIQLLNTATAGTAAIRVGGGMGNGGLPGHLVFHDSSTAGAASIFDGAGVLGPNFKNASPNPVDGFAGETRFFDNSKAGTAQFINEGEFNSGASSGEAGGYTAFAGNSSADHASFVLRGATSSDGLGGRADFSGNSTADHGTFTNLNSNTGTQYSGGRTVFFETATAGSGLFINVGGDGGFLETGGTTEFRGSSTAGNGTFMNLGGTGGSFPQAGKTQFFDTASAGSATFSNNAASGGGGAVEFYGHSTAGGGTFINNGASATPVNGGTVTFKEDSAAGQAHFHTTGPYGGYISFLDRSSSDLGTFVIDPDINNARIVFYGTATASNASFEVGAGADIQFFESSSAGNSTILLRGNGGGTSLGTFGGTAGSANITVMGAEFPGTVGANLSFAYPGTAENATITINGASVTTFGANGGLARFDYSSSAGKSAITVNGGSNGGAGARLEFARGATADQAAIVVNAGGTLDVSGNAFYNGTVVGSLARAGSVYLGSSALSVGGLNTDTTFSGVISDLNVPGNYGALTKTGTGTLVLSGANLLKGLTTVAAGTLVVNGSLPGGVQVNGGAVLKGSGNIGGTLTVAPGGTVAPGNSPGTLIIHSNYVQGAQGALEIEVAGPNPVNRDLLNVQGNVNLSGTLLLVFSGYAPAAGESFPVVQAAGTLSVSNLNLVVLGLKPGFTPTYQVNGSQLIITAGAGAQLRTAADPVQVLNPWYSPQTGFVYTVLTLTGQTYQFDTSTDLKNWTPVSTISGSNALHEFRYPPPVVGEARRFFRIGQQSSGP